MKTELLAAAALAAWTASAAEEAMERPNVNLDGYRLVWSDDFDGTEIDRTKWASPHQERQGSSIWDERNVEVRDGAAVFTIRKTDDPVFRYESACLRTTKSYDPKDRLFEFTYGYVEARCKLPRNVRGDYWFAVWMMVGNVGDPDTRKGVEVDIMETFHMDRGGEIPHTFHWNGYGKLHNSAGTVVAPNPELLDGGWHTFGCLWTEDSMSFTIDGRITWTTDLKGLGSDQDGKVKSMGCPRVPGYIKLSAEAAPWAGPHGDRWEDPMPERDEALVDWVRVWQKDPQ